jgi:hypothetical protein
MRHDGNDAGSDLFRQQRWGDRDPHFRGADDIVIFPLQCSTQWDALSHVFFEGRMYNGFAAENVTSGGAYRTTFPWPKIAPGAAACCWICRE